MSDYTAPTNVAAGQASSVAFNRDALDNIRHLKEGTDALRTNSAGATLIDGAVVVLNASGNATATTSANHAGPLAVVVKGVADGGQVYLRRQGVATVAVQGAVAITDRLATSTTTQRAKADNTGANAFAIALTANASGAGTVTAFVAVDLPAVVADLPTHTHASAGQGGSTLTAPTIADFTNAAHDHGDADDGGAIVTAALPAVLPVRISETVVTGSVAANIDLTSIPGTYRHLLLLLYARGDTAATTTTVLLRLNNDSGANYDLQTLSGNAAAAAASESFAATSVNMGGMPAASAGSNLFNQYAITVLSYADATSEKLLRSNMARKIGTASGNLLIDDRLGAWRSTAAITRITLTPGAGNFAIGTVATLYGVY